jgi:CO/xanthine dehydrogenase Mo-binding subunit
VSNEIRAAGWAEAVVLMAASRALSGTQSDSVTVHHPAGGWATAAVQVDADGYPRGVEVEVGCGAVLDDVVLRSYATGAAHMGLGWVCSEAIAVDDHGQPTDLTIRSFGILRARETPEIAVTIRGDDSAPPVPVSDAVFAAVAAATWIAQGLPTRWPTTRGG